MIEIKEISMQNKKDMMKFVRFPHHLFKDVKQYVPTLDGDEYNELTPAKNGAFEWCEAHYFLAYKGKEIVGRIGTIYNKKYIEKTGLHQLRITRFDFIDDEEVTKALINKATEVARQYGCNQLIGPIGFCDMDKEGMLIKGFDQLSMYITLWNFPYYVKHMEDLGFRKELDWHEFRLKLPETPNPALDKICQRSMKKFGYKLKTFKTKKEIYPFIRRGLRIMNETYSFLLGYTELSERQMDEFINNFGIVLNTEYLFAVMSKDDDLVGYGFFAPSLSKAMKKGNGKLTLPTIFSLLHDLKHNDTVDFYSIGVRPQYMGTGVNAIIVNEGIKACCRHGIKFAETGPELETNQPIHDQWKDFDKEQHKTRRCWIKDLD